MVIAALPVALGAVKGFIAAHGADMASTLLTSAGTQGIGKLMGLFGSSNSAAEAAKRQYNYQRLLNQQQYDLTQQGYRESPTNQRLGLEAAGYNPILALGGGGLSYGSYSAGSASAPMDSTTSDLGNMVTNAYQTFKLAKDKNNADIAGIMAGIKGVNADVALKTEQAITEQYRRDEMASNTLLNNMRSITEDESRPYFIRKLAAETYSTLTNAEVSKGMLAAKQVENNINAQNAETNAGQLELNKEWTPYKIGGTLALGAIGAMGAAYGPAKFKALKALGKIRPVGFKT